MVSKSTDCSSKLRKLQAEQASDVFGTLTHKIQLLKKQIQADRVVSVREKLEENRKNLEGHVSLFLSVATSRNDVSVMEANGQGKMLSSRIKTPPCKFSGFAQGSGDKDYTIIHEVVFSTSVKLPHIDKIPPYTTWIFLDRNQRMAEDQSVVGRRRIYYDPHGSEALICSDSEEEIAEPEEEKREFSEGEDRILWMAFEEHGLNEEVLNIVSQHIGGTTSEIQERCNMLKEKNQVKHEQNFKGCKANGSEKNNLLEKSLSAALDSFDNLFCRRCLVFDCRLHGCSQSLINPIERQSYSSESDDDGNPCSDQCYLRIKIRGFLSHIQQLYSCYWGIYSIKVHSVSPYGLPSPHPQDANNDNQQPAEASGVGRSWVQSMFTRDTSLRANSFSRVRKWTSDGGNLAANENGTPRKQDSTAGQKKIQTNVRLLRGHTGAVTALHCVTRREVWDLVGDREDAGFFISGNTDCSVKIWDPSLRGSELRATLKGHTGTVRSVSSDRGKVVSGSDDQSVIIWDKKTTQLLEELKGHDAQLAANQGFAPPAPSEVACH